jgi:hypothetical protein
VSIVVEAHDHAEMSVQPRKIIDTICGLPWHKLEGDEILHVARAYYYFSIQFRENLEIARTVWPDDPGLSHLYREECNTDNLSPWPHVADVKERLDHDEFMRRLLALQRVEAADRLDQIGAAYIARVRAMDEMVRAQSIISYEDGGLSQVFQAILNAPCWDGLAAQAFKFFLLQHIKFDENEDAGHGAMVRHIKTDWDVTPIWEAFYDILAASVPRLFRQSAEGPRHAMAKQPFGIAENLDRGTLVATI